LGVAGAGVTTGGRVNELGGATVGDAGGGTGGSDVAPLKRPDFRRTNRRDRNRGDNGTAWPIHRRRDAQRLADLQAGRIIKPVPASEVAVVLAKRKCDAVKRVTALHDIQSVMRLARGDLLCRRRWRGGRHAPLRAVDDRRLAQRYGGASGERGN
jgi:hypothetical protein